LLEANSQAMELLEKFPSLASGMEINEDGLITFTEDG